MEERKYLTTWKRYMPVIRLHLKKSLNEDQQFKLNVEIPVNTTAEIWVPLKYGEQITESGKSISAVEGVVLQRKESGYAVIQAGSGIYSFVASK